MKMQTLRPLFLSLAIPAWIAVQAWAADESINNTIKVEVKSRKDWTLTFEKGAQEGAKDSSWIDIAPSGSNRRVEHTFLEKPGENMVFKPGMTYTMTFHPNFGDDGSKYVLKLTDSLKSCQDCVPKPMSDQYVTFRAEKPVSTLFTSKASRKLVLTLAWEEPRHIVFSGMGGQTEEEQKEKEIAAYFKGDTLTLAGDYF